MRRNKPIAPAKNKATLVVGIIVVLTGLGVMLFDFVQGYPFSIFSLAPVTVGMLAIALSLQKRRRGPRLPE